LLPNLAKNTRKRVVFREDSSSSITSLVDQKQSVFVYAPWQNKNKDEDNTENQDKYLNFEADKLIILKLTCSNPLKIDLIIDHIELILDPTKSIAVKALAETFAL
jgi:hypothetical protein